MNGKKHTKYAIKCDCMYVSCLRTLSKRLMDYFMINGLQCLLCNFVGINSDIHRSSIVVGPTTVSKAG